MIFAAVYLAGCAGWYSWSQMFQSQTAGGMGYMFKFLNPRMAIIQPMNLLLVIGWASLATPLLALLGYRRFFRLPSVLQDAAISFLLTFGFYYFFYLDQAHGWGYRYAHGALSCLVLIAIAGWDWLSEAVGEGTAKIFIGAGLALSLLLQLPLRSVEAESFIRPYARTAAVMRALPADIVAFNPSDGWYSADLIRNDPYLDNRPLILAITALSPEAIAVLKGAGKIRIIDRTALARLGMDTVRFTDFEDDPFTLGRGSSNLVGDLLSSSIRPDGLSTEFMRLVSVGRQLADHLRRVVKAIEGFRVFGIDWTNPWLCYAASPILNRVWAGKIGKFHRFSVRWGQCDLYTFGNLFEDYPVRLIEEALDEVDMVVDLGANVGAFSLLIDSLLRKRKIEIAAIEPNSANVQFLRDQPFARSLAIHHAAVGPKDGTAHLVRGKNSVSDYVDFSTKSEGTAIPVLSLESLCPRPALVKMDIEGGEWEIFAKGLPDTVRFLVLEWHPQSGAQASLLPNDFVPGGWKEISTGFEGLSIWLLRR